jgi:hypothetical protein
MNGRRARAIRKALNYTRPSPASESGISVSDRFNDDGTPVLVWKQRTNPKANLYRLIKRGYTRGRFKP